MRIACVTALTAMLFVGPEAIAQDLFLKNAQVVDPAAQQVRYGHLLIVGGIIRGPVERVPPDFRGDSLDVAGGWVIPGLNDLHTHSYGNMAPGNVFDGPGTAVVARRMLYAGVTGFLDLFGLEAAMFALRDRQRAGAVGGADLFAAGSCLTATNGHCTEYGIPTRVMDTPEDARREVAELTAQAPDVVKVVYAPGGRMPSIDEPTLRAAIATASARGIKTVIHVNSWAAVRDAVLAGASAVTHVPDDGPVPGDLARLIAERGVYHIPTLAVHTDFGDFINDPTVLEHPLARALTTEAIRQAYRSDSLAHHYAERAERAAREQRMVYQSVRAIADAGGTLLTGTDAGNWGTLQGFSLHRELQKLVEAGLTPWQALGASTTNAGRFLGRRFGVTAGDEGNLVILEASPLTDIRNTQRIVQVIHHGVVIDREALLSAGVQGGGGGE